MEGSNMVVGKPDNPASQSVVPKTAARKAYQKPTLLKTALLDLTGIDVATVSQVVK
jgi:hypothetical protein